MAKEVWVVFLSYPPAFSLHSDFIDSSSRKFVAVGRKMVINLVGNSLWADTPASTMPLLGYRICA